MRKSIIVTLMVLCLTASLASLASAERGYVFFGTDFHGTGHGFNVPSHTIVAAEFQFSDELAVAADMALGESGFGLSARYGVGSGAYVMAAVNSGSVGAWGAGAFFERELSERLDLRAMVGFGAYDNGGTTALMPDATVQLKYDLDGPFSIMANIMSGVAVVGLGYEF